MNVYEFQGVLEQLDLVGLLPTVELRTREAELNQPSYREFLLGVLNEAARLKAPAARSASQERYSRLCVGPEARWFEVADKDLVDLGRRGPIRRILLALIDAHIANPGHTLDVPAVIRAGWPHENVRPDAGATRVYTAIRTLRRMGLDGILLTRDSGYLIDPNTTIERRDSDRPTHRAPHSVV